MLFNESAFFILFLLTFLIYYFTFLHKRQIIILVISSFIFYSWKLPQLLVLLLLSILINGITSYKVAFSNKNKVIWAFVGVILNLFILTFFKYGALVNNLITQTFDIYNDSIVTPLLNLPLPIGISFYTFEGISLLVDVLRNRANQQKVFFVDRRLNNHLLKTSLFIAFFPHLIAGPILKATNFYPQIKAKYFCQIHWSLVFRSLVVGYFLKMVIADNLKDYTIWLTFPYYQSINMPTSIVLLFGYSMQIFSDFAGYSLIAIGAAAAFGYNLPQNFNFPYISRSLSEFWRRWHISLTNWLKDYLYIPLGGNRKGRLRTYANLMIVMVLGGLWHGASWSYAVWGGYHGIGLVIERFVNERFKINSNQSIRLWQQSILEFTRLLLVFSFVSLGWLLFKISDFGQVLDFINIMIHNVKAPLIRPLTDSVIVFSIPVVIYHLVNLPTLQNWKAHFPQNSNSKVLDVLKDIALGVMLTMIVLNSGRSNEFIYFQF